ncbi:uncharacterized protein TNCV_4142711 [Trichonephila clavipes]|nr:uncharacterized protein TNCV_4142711 [Trichonephila clavipes]
MNVSVANPFEVKRKSTSTRCSDQVKVCFSCASTPVSSLSQLPSFFLMLLCCAGLLENQSILPKKRIVFYALLFCSCAQIIIEYATDFNAIRPILSIPILISLACNLMSWFILRQKRLKLTYLVGKLKDIHVSTYTKKSNSVAFFIFFLPLVYSVLYTIDCATELTPPFQIYGMEMENTLVEILFISVSKYLQFFIDVTLPCLVAYVYCILCFHCSSGINILTQQVDQHTPETFGPQQQIVILRKKAEIDDVLDDIQNVFSMSAFFAIISCLMNCCNVLGIKLIPNLKHLYMTDVIEVVFYGTAGLLCLTATLWVAGGLAIELSNLKEAFYKRAHSRFLLFPSLKEPNCKQELLEKPEFVLMGCNILSYRRSSLFTLVGALLTYTVLIFQM